MKNNPLNILFGIVAGVLLGQSASATTYLTETFNNYATGQLGAVGTGGGGTIPGWNTPSTSLNVTNGSGSLVGTGLGLVASTGDKVSITASNMYLVAGYNNGAYNKFVPSGAFPQSAPTNLYYSFLYRFDVGTDVSTTGQAITAVNRENSGASSVATFHWTVYAKRVGSAIQLGIAKYGGTTTNYATTNITAGQTVFVVVRQQIITGAGNDIEDLWINPPANSFGVDEASVPPVSATTTDGTEDASTTGPGRFWIFASGAQADLDELRIASSWAEATPPAGQCIPASVVTDPTNLTQSAEISASFSVVAAGTSPNYQWQISQNGGSTWSNLAGAVFANYTTPNLALATDNGNKYRAIVNVPCNNSSATSAVATVTLTPPVVTPTGVVMDDFFQDAAWNGLGFDSRANTPVSSSNSVWFTSVSADLDASAGNGMVATPISGTSSLDLGYFVDESTTNLPVDLAIGNTIKVTLPFIPNSFNAFTNNGAFRFGLFDYADGGTLVTADSSTVSGSAGNGAGVRGYMLSVDFGTKFTANSPLTLYVRNGLTDNNLMGTTGDYISLGSGPSGGGYSNAPAFLAGTTYTVVLAVTRTAVNTCSLAASITGGGTNWSFSATDTNGYAYHRFDAFALRANELENAPDTYTIPEFKVEVTAPGTPASIKINSVSHSGNSVTLSWTPTPAGTFSYSVLRAASLTGAWTTNATGISGTSYTDASATDATGFYRVTSP